MDLTYKDEIEILSKTIGDAHKGKILFSAKEVGKIIGKDQKFVNPAFDEYGILAVQQGQRKYYSAVAIAEYIYQNKTSPLRRVKGARAS